MAGRAVAGGELLDLTESPRWWGVMLNGRYQEPVEQEASPWTVGTEGFKPGAVVQDPTGAGCGGVYADTDEWPIQPSRIQWAAASKPVQAVEAAMTVSGKLHSDWPLANHIYLGSAAVGIAGDRLAWGQVDSSERSGPKTFNKTSHRIQANTWVQVRLSVSSRPGAVDAFFRRGGTNDWIRLGTVENALPENGVSLQMFSQGERQGLIDDVRIFSDVPAVETFDRYPDTSQWIFLPCAQPNVARGNFRIKSGPDGTKLIYDGDLPAGNHVVRFEMLPQSGSERVVKELIYNVPETADSQTLSINGLTAPEELAGGWALRGLQSRSEPWPTPDSVASGLPEQADAEVPGNWHRQFAQTFPEGYRSEQKQKGSYWYERNPIPWYTQGWYYRSFDTPARQAGGRVFIRFNSVAYHSRIFVNGHLAGEHKGSFDRFGVDVTPYLKPADETNELAVWVQNDFGESPPLHAYGSMFSYRHNHGGITGPVYLEVSPPVEFRDILIDPDLSGQKVRVRASVSCARLDVRYEALVTDLKGNRRSDAISLQIADGKLTGSIPAGQLEKWSTTNPKQYALHIRAIAGNEVVGHEADVFGYRQFEIKGSRFYLNGERVRMTMGNIITSGHTRDIQSYLHLKGWLSRQQQQGVNTIRYHITGEQAPFTLSDELGLMVYAESPIFHRVYSGIADAAARANYLDHAGAEVERFMVNSYNHPSLMLWSLSNEVWHNNLKDVYEGLYTRASAIEQGTRPKLPTSGLTSHGTPNYAVSTDWFDDHNYVMNKTFCPGYFPRAIENRLAFVAAVYGAIDRPWIVSEFDWTRPKRPRLKADASYAENYKANKDSFTIRRIGLEAASKPDYIQTELQRFSRQIHEVLRMTPEFQGCHPWLEDRNQLPAYYPSVAGPYSVLLDPLNRVSHGVAGQQAALQVVLVKDPETVLPFDLQVQVGDSASATLSGEMGADQEYWRAAVNVQLPEESGCYKVRLSVIGKDSRICTNEYEFWVVDPVEKISAPAHPIGIVGENEQALAGLERCFASGVSWKKIGSESDLTSLQEVIVLPGGTSSSDLRQGALDRWVRDGGSLLILEQTDMNADMSEERSVSGGYTLLAAPQTANNFVDILMPEHPAFNGIERVHMWNLAGYSNLVVESVLSEFGDGAGVVAAAGQYPVLLDGHLGGGRLCISQIIACCRVDQDPVAHRYLTNLLREFFTERSWEKLVSVAKKKEKSPLVFAAETIWNPLDIQPLYNRRTADSTAAGEIGFLDLGSMDLSHMPVGTLTVDGIPFAVKSPENPNVIVLKGGQLPDLPAETEPLAVGRKLDYLAVLHTAWYCGKTAVVSYVFQYDDGSTVAVECVGGERIGDWYEPKPLPQAAVGWAKPHPANLVRLGCYAAVLPNPHPEKVVRAVRIVSAEGPAVPVVLSITGGSIGR